MSDLHIDEYFHVIWCTSDQKHSLNQNVRERLVEYMGGTIRARGSVQKAGAVASNHVHSIISLAPGTSLSDLIRDVKVASSGWLSAMDSLWTGWAPCYAAFSFSPDNLHRYAKFCHEQETYHRMTSFEAELLQLLNLHEMSFKERYVFQTTHVKRLTHLVWSTKNRDSWIDMPTGRYLMGVFAGLARNAEMTLLNFGHYYDHVHLLLDIPAKVVLGDAIAALKSLSTRKLNREGHGPFRSWQSGFGAYSVSVSALDAVNHYIDNQYEHHVVWDPALERCAMRTADPAAALI